MTEQQLLSEALSLVIQHREEAENFVGDVAILDTRHALEIARYGNARAQQVTEVRERELLRKLEALQMRLAPIDEARQQARNAALEEAALIADTIHTINASIIAERIRALKSTASGGSK